MAPGLLGALAWILAAQGGPPAVAGTIRDGESGAALSGAVVTLTDAGRATVTDDEGRYRLNAVAAGPQHLSVKRLGYEPRMVHALIPGDGVLRLDLSIRPLPLQLPPIVVRSTIAMRGLDDGAIGSILDRGISAVALRNHPMLAEPDGFLALGGGGISAAPEAPSGLHLRGGAADHTAYLLDGVPVFSPYHAAGTFSAWNPDALERIQIQSASPSLTPPDALAGAVMGTTRAPGRELTTYGTMSTSHARLTLHGPLPGTGAGFLLSLRSGFPGVVAPESDASYLRGSTGDLLAKVEAPALRGRLHVLLYDSRNQLDAAASAESPGGAADPARNAFEWDSRSAGLTWSRTLPSGEVVQVRAWSALGEAEAGWRPAPASRLALEAEREDQAVLATIERAVGRRLTGIGIRLQRSRTSYRVSPREGAGDGTSLDIRIPQGTLLARHREPVAERVTAEGAAVLTGAVGALRLGWTGELRWNVAPTLSVSAGYARSHQFAQSLRNPESVAGGIFPADLFLGAGATGVPVARSDRVVAGARWRPIAGMHLGAEAYAAALDGVVLAAPRTGAPFATGGFTTGSGTVRGAAIEATVSGPRYGLTASYGLQRVRASYADSSFTPGHATGQMVELGAIVFPVPTASVRLGFTGALGRRGTSLLGTFEWESCNLLDQGCEFAGSPVHGGPPGAQRLPDYFRLDLGARKHWHVRLGGRDVEVGFFGTVTNLLGRRNVLAIATDPSTGERTPIEMRPLAPLVVGLDWRF